MCHEIAIESASYNISNIKETPHSGLYIKDKRYDPIVGSALIALESSLRGVNLIDPTNICIIALTDTGCINHIKKVEDGIKINRPRQAYFVRAGAQTIATYAAMALNTHGLTMTLSGTDENITHSLSILKYMMTYHSIQNGIILSSDVLNDDIISSAIIFSLARNNTDTESYFRNYIENNRTPPSLTMLNIINHFLNDKRGENGKH